jgi:hypothetical protein
VEAVEAAEGAALRATFPALSPTSQQEAEAVAPAEQEAAVGMKAWAAGPAVPPSRCC